MTFTIYPAIDLRDGKVVRLKEGDLSRLTRYSDDPAAMAEQWLSQGTRWLHVVNLDAAFDQASSANHVAIERIVNTAERYSANIQSGGGIRNLEGIERALNLGITRVILGTMLVEQPDAAAQAIARWGADKIVAGIDARDGMVKTHGWAETTSISAVDFTKRLSEVGFEWVIYTDIARDGMSSGINLPETSELAAKTGIKIIASGGIRTSHDVIQVKDAGLAGVIIGRALYEGNIDLYDLLQRVSIRKES
jgi:phosphoribosylformimino-5-aminoimidazole carboxamide ribotide isomerase